MRGLTAELKQVPIDKGHSTLAEIRFSIATQRRYQFYLWKIFLPLTLMVTVSWAVFWLRPVDLDNQIMVAVTTILTVIAFAFSISVTLPKVPYLTFIDAFFLTCYVFVFLSIVELMTVHVIERRGATKLALQVRLWSRFSGRVPIRESNNGSSFLRLAPEGLRPDDPVYLSSEDKREANS